MNASCYDVTHSSFLAGCTRRLPGILVYHYHAHHPAAWSKISEYISNGLLVLIAHSWPRVSLLVSVEFNKKLVAPSTIIFRYRQHAVRPIPHVIDRKYLCLRELCLSIYLSVCLSVCLSTELWCVEFTCVYMCLIFQSCFYCVCLQFLCFMSLAV